MFTIFVSVFYWILFGRGRLLHFILVSNGVCVCLWDFLLFYLWGKKPIWVFVFESKGISVFVTLLQGQAFGFQKNLHTLRGCIFLKNLVTAKHRLFRLSKRPPHIPALYTNKKNVENDKDKRTAYYLFF